MKRMIQTVLISSRTTGASPPLARKMLLMRSITSLSQAGEDTIDNIFVDIALIKWVNSKTLDAIRY